MLNMLNKKSTLSWNILFLIIRCMTNITKNGNETSILLTTTLNENGYIDNSGKICKKFILRPDGITEAIAVNSFTSPPPHIFNFHSIYVTAFVITIEINEAKMNLTLVEIKVKIRLEIIPKNNKEYVNQSGTIFLLIS